MLVYLDDGGGDIVQDIEFKISSRAWQSVEAKKVVKDYRLSRQVTVSLRDFLCSNGMAVESFQFSKYQDMKIYAFHCEVVFSS